MIYTIYYATNDKQPASRGAKVLSGVCPLFSPLQCVRCMCVFFWFSSLRLDYHSGKGENDRRRCFVFFPPVKSFGGLILVKKLPLALDGSISSVYTLIWRPKGPYGFAQSSGILAEAHDTTYSSHVAIQPVAPVCCSSRRKNQLGLVSCDPTWLIPESVNCNGMD